MRFPLRLIPCSPERLQPSRAAFLEMMTSDGYRKSNVERENGCADHAIVAMRETYNRLGAPQNH